MAAGYQQAVMESLAIRVGEALHDYGDWKCVACVGGVAKNKFLRRLLEQQCESAGLPLVTVPLGYCTDNAAMIAAVPLLRKMEKASALSGIDPNLPLQGLRLRGN
ncbi:MAG: hypothetical protein ACO3N7_09490 [Kiritimatiellia bacterium]